MQYLVKLRVPGDKKFAFVAQDGYEGGSTCWKRKYAKRYPTKQAATSDAAGYAVFDGADVKVIKDKEGGR